ncbi:MAG: hypothetical protein R3A80_13460 [Bdellovibrionota bacterium]
MRKERGFMRGVLKPNGRNSQNNKFFFLGVALLALSSACGKTKSQSPSLAELNASRVNAAVDADRAFDTDDGELRVVGRARFEQLIRDGEIRRINPDADTQSPEALLIGFPKHLLAKSTTSVV